MGTVALDTCKGSATAFPEEFWSNGHRALVAAHGRLAVPVPELPVHPHLIRPRPRDRRSAPGLSGRKPGRTRLDGRAASDLRELFLRQAGCGRAAAGALPTRRRGPRRALVSGRQAPAAAAAWRRAAG